MTVPVSAMVTTFEPPTDEMASRVRPVTVPATVIMLLPLPLTRIAQTFTEDFAAGQHVDGVVLSYDPYRFIGRADDRAGDADRAVAADDEDPFRLAEHHACRADVDVVVAGGDADGGHRSSRKRRR